MKRTGVVAVTALLAGALGAGPASARAHNCTGGGSNCITVSGSGLRVTDISASYTPAPRTESGRIAKLKIEIPGQRAKTHWENASTRQGRPVSHDWGHYAKRYPNGTKLCTGWKFTSGLACATVHN
ncbi:hypothetical protein [Streptomyces sp. NPDC005805]|uniref:hypothetical protein n=1 Tax=Streptomyces sp. NPDC005805 TaxID=3157068 RepID=UPI0033D3326E